MFKFCLTRISLRWQKIKELLELQKQMMENDGSNDSAVPLSSLQHSQRKRSTVRPQSSATSGDVDSGSEQSDSSLDFLKLPQVDTNENVDISEKQVSNTL